MPLSLSHLAIPLYRVADRGILFGSPFKKPSIIAVDGIERAVLRIVHSQPRYFVINL
jgi:hypothetical protein